MFQNYQIAYLRDHVKVREVQRFSFLRQSVAYILSQSAREVPHAAAITHYDVTPLVEYGKRGSKAIEEADKVGSERAALLRRAIRRNFSAFFMKAIAHCLHHAPQLNGFLDYATWRTGGRLYIAEDINLGFTVDTKYGVIKPFVHNPHKKELETVAKEMRLLARRARRTDPEELYRKAARAYVRTALRQLDLTGLPALWVYLRASLRRKRPDPELAAVPESEKLQITDILGATCTVANIGMMMSGHQTVTVIIPPEVTMFGIGDIRQVPWVVDGEVVPRYAVTVVGTIDHRALDGGEAFPFYEHLKRYIDDPALIYDWKPGDPI